MTRAEIDWERLDKLKFFYVGTGLFSGVTTILFPLSVIKTRQMSLEGVSGGLSGARQVVATMYRNDGIRGFYRGFGTVMLGTLPSRMVYLTSLELIKSGCYRAGHNTTLSEPALAGVANFLAGAGSSLLTQLVVVPVDVVSQRLMVHSEHAHERGQAKSSASSEPQGRNGREDAWSQASTGVNRSANRSSAQRMSGVKMVRLIVQEEGLGGLYRGFGMSLATYVPSSGVWWGAYGAYQKLLWQYIFHDPHPSPTATTHSVSEVMTVQTLSAALAGATSATITNPLDLVKTRLQVGVRKEGQAPTVRQVVRSILQEEGPGGFWRGVVPRIASSTLWGTCMVSTYEFLKRICQLPEEEG